MKTENRERFCAQHMLQQYDELLACEKLGYYNSCEMISVFILEKNTKYIYNFYTIFIMEERLTVKEGCNDLTDKLLSISQRFTMNKALKNNFHNGSYILEFFDAEERVKNLFSKKELRKITEIIFDCIPIDLFTLSDRIGNFIF